MNKNEGKIICQNSSIHIRILRKRSSALPIVLTRVLANLTTTENKAELLDHPPLRQKLTVLPNSNENPFIRETEGN